MSTKIATLDMARAFNARTKMLDTAKRGRVEYKTAAMASSIKAPAIQAEQCAVVGFHGPSGSGSTPAKK